MTAAISNLNNKVEITNNDSQIKEILAGINVPIVKKSVDEKKRLKEEYKEKLNAAYGLVRVQRESLLLLGEILTKFGRLRFEENSPSCMVMMRASLNAQLKAIGLLDTLCFDLDADQLTTLEEALFQHDKFTVFDQFLLSSDMNAIAAAIQGKNLPKEQLELMGSTISWMSNGMLHTKEYKDNIPQFEQVFLLGQLILTMAQSEKGNLELAELYYNGLKKFEIRKNFNNLSGAHKWLDKALALIPSKEMLARIANVKSCDYAGRGHFIQAAGFLDLEITIRQSLPLEEQNHLLISHLRWGKTGFLYKENYLKEADDTIDLALAFAASCRGERHPQTDKLLTQKSDHQYFGQYDYRKAQIKMALKEYKEAHKHINRALETYSHFKQEDFIVEAEMMKQTILEKLA